MARTIVNIVCLVVLLGTIALRLPGSALKWDAKSMTISGHERAAAMLSKDYRKGWEIEA